MRLWRCLRRVFVFSRLIKRAFVSVFVAAPSHTRSYCFGFSVNKTLRAHSPEPLAHIKPIIVHILIAKNPRCICAYSTQWLQKKKSIYSCSNAKKPNYYYYCLLACRIDVQFIRFNRVRENLNFGCKTNETKLAHVKLTHELPCCHTIFTIKRWIYLCCANTWIIK